jgi:hypothetical protein
MVMPNTAVPAAASDKSGAKGPVKRKKLSIEKTMVLIALVFFSGIFMYSFTEPDTPMRTMGMTVFSVGLIWVLFRFGR